MDLKKNRFEFGARAIPWLLAKNPGWTTQLSETVLFFFVIVYTERERKESFFLLVAPHCGVPLH
jgi:hypothetical protein